MKKANAHIIILTLLALFERLEPSIEGTDVGLALVKRIIEHHGGLSLPSAPR